ncbi:MAG: response regulator transcription factor [bacterium]
MIRVLLADDHSLFRDGIKAIFENNSKIQIIGEADDGFSLIKKYFEMKPDIVISDISMPNKNGPDAAKAILLKDKNARIIFLSQYTLDNYVYEVIQSGAVGLLSKNIIKAELIMAINEVYKGNNYFVGRTKEELENIVSKYDSIVNKDTKPKGERLTNREIEVLLAIGNGFDREKIARELNISKRTFDAHRLHIMSKIKVKKQTELIKFAVELKLKKEKELEKS